jgi:hypothetical protein
MLPVLLLGLAWFLLPDDKQTDEVIQHALCETSSTGSGGSGGGIPRAPSTDNRDRRVSDDKKVAEESAGNATNTGVDEHASGQTPTKTDNADVQLGEPS